MATRYFSAFKLTPGGGGILSRYEEVHLQRLVRVDAVLVEVGDAFAGQEGVIDR